MTSFFVAVLFVGKFLLVGSGGAAPSGITHVGSDSAAEGSNQNTITLTLPSHQTDDVGLAFLINDNNIENFSFDTSGWTAQYDVGHATGRDRQVQLWFRRFTSGAETNPSASIDVNEEHSMIVHVFRGVSTSTIFDVTEQIDEDANNSLPTNLAITTVTDNAAVLLWHGANNNDITVAGVPTTPAGLVLGETIIGSGNVNNQQILAYDLDVATAGTVTPTVWTHTASPTNQAEYSTTTIALRPE